LTVGIVTIGSGPYAAISKESIEAANVTADELNAGQHKFKIKIDQIDTDGTAAGTLQAVTKAVQTDHIGFVSGFFTSDTAPAVSSQAQRLGILVLTAVAQSSFLVGKNCSPNSFQFDAVDSQYALANAKVLAQANIPTWDAISEDYSTGHDKVDTFVKTIQGLGGQVNTKVFPAFGATDDGTQIAQLKKSSSEGLFAALLGADAVTFAKQATQFGLFGKYKFMLSSGYLQQPLLQAMGNAVAGTHEVLNYSPDAIAKTQFAKDYAKLDKTGLWHVPISGNLALTMLDDAADQAASTDPTKIASALAGLTANTVVGQVTMRAQDHLLLQPLYPAHAVKGANGPTLVVDSTIPASEVTPPVSPDCKMS
jgi:branched-chain amino acid transport system substrate-binding protein